MRTRPTGFALLALAVLLGAGCAATRTAPRADLEVRVRSDLGAPLNADAGWAGDAGEMVTVLADRPFRIRFEATPPPGDDVWLQARRNGGPWSDAEAHDFPYPEAATPRVSVVSTDAYSHGAVTTDRLGGSSRPFAAGAGLTLRAASPAWTGAAGAHGEWEVPVVIRRYADGPVANEAGDRFTFRLVDGAGRAVSAEAAVALAIAPGHLGGTFVETPARIGPFQAATGDLHVILEPTETDNAMMVVASDDGGATWREVDGPNRPAADDLEGVGAALLGGTIHVLHQTSDAVWHHAFDTADAASGTAGWSQTDVLVAEPGEPPTQTAALVARPDGTLVGVYGAPTNLRLKTWSPEAGWGEEQAIGAPAPSLSGVQAVLGAGGEVHIAFTGSDGTAWHLRLRPDGTLTEPQRLAGDLGTAEADAGAIAPLVFVPETGETSVLYRTADGVLTERRVRPGGSVTPPEAVSDRDVAQSPIDSEQVAADAVAHDGAVHVLFVQEQTGRLYRASRPAGGAWGSEEVAQAGANVQWVRGAVVRRADGSVVYGYVYDAGSNGGTGMNRYGEIVLQEP